MRFGPFLKQWSPCGRLSRQRLQQILLSLSAMLFMCLLLLYGTGLSWSSRTPVGSLNNGNGNDSKARLEPWPGIESSCKFPRLDAVSDKMKSYFRETPKFNCSANYTMRFRSTYGNQIAPVRENSTLEKGETCCYKVVARDGGGPKGTSRISKKCFPVSLKAATDVPASHEFVYLQCRLPNTAITHEDMFAFVHPKKRNKTEKKKKIMNILILGLDAQSRLNFVRTMPLSNTFLLKNLSAIPLKGYTRVGENSLPNLVPLLSGLTIDELKKTCWPRNGVPFDECPFIWKNFAKEGYLTSYSEDGVSLGTFTYNKKGFLQPPTDYYLHHLLSLMNEKIGHLWPANLKLCYGPRLGFEILLDYAVKVAVTLGKNGDSYFNFVWANSLFHDYINYAKLGDKPLLKTLSFLQENGYLENTLLLVLGDHGIRMGAFRGTPQGKIEEKLPLAYLVFPPRFRKKYGKEMAFLKENGENRLATHFDTYATLLHVLQLETGKRHGKKEKRHDPRGISLLKNISKSRTCLQAGVDEFNCVCNYAVSPIPMNDPEVLSASNFVVRHINALLEERVPVNNGSKCATLMLRNITEAVTKEVGDSKKAFQVTFQAFPGGAIFEAMLSFNRTLLGWKRWNILGDVKRLDSYGKQSKCIQDEKVKKYCYCN